MKIGILGGSFAPIHNGHIHIARMALEKASLDQVWLMPSGMAPHKDIAQSATRFQRQAV
jgi:nicotinate-nucleotide adenylyltransferase